MVPRAAPQRPGLPSFLVAGPRAISVAVGAAALSFVHSWSILPTFPHTRAGREDAAPQVRDPCLLPKFYPRRKWRDSPPSEREKSELDQELL
jgi:hypothetical protein